MGMISGAISAGDSGEEGGDSSLARFLPNETGGKDGSTARICSSKNSNSLTGGRKVNSLISVSDFIQTHHREGVVPIPEIWESSVEKFCGQFLLGLWPHSE